MIEVIIKKRIRTMAKQRNAIAWRIGVPIVVAAPLLLLPANVFFIASVLTFLIVVFGVFGAGQALGDDRAKGALQKMAIAPIEPSVVVFGEMIVNAAVIGIQFAPLVAAVWIIAPSGAGMALTAYMVALVCTAVFASAIGAILVPLLPEMRTTVFSVLVFLTLVFSGVLVPLRTATQIAIAKLLPPAYLYQATLLLFGKEAVFSLWEIVVLGAFPTIIMLLVVDAVAKKIVR